MTSDELKYIMLHPTDSCCDLYDQLRELERSDEDSELQQEIKFKLDQICAINSLAWRLDPSFRLALQDVYFLPGAFGKHWTRKPTKDQLATSRLAVDALLEVMAAQEWDLRFYNHWRVNFERCINCLKTDQLCENCWLDPKGIVRKFYQDINHNTLPED